ncbi:leucine--tRNA ligase [Pyrococcus abyssi]|uniref:Leucine--tRNA ligase n=1 Tax=Pyrococcus abyssi (strain GE5 / Orsay) TaxID=272844 RepID=SYL_PYRAB|nr:leucine--tRNA ligase [Pyrococcus abyssi]Q9V0B9.1 RecName: Full=Leucine--tRNA ligase; AltName: Full=Leucyl-tRNA synthetase; Short=LeuRS [Pyrococcus abyssi GE5]CAB49785.1 leuS leucyl-tRNA synthetase [Pyrococcus abyssi GE5]CCE70276.1 TPA: leucyl-tRNA synthetase [Pyrococcus abyssi GE5]
MPELNFRAIEEKWQKRWLEAKVFEPNIKDKPKEKKFYITVAFPYLSGHLHVGHARTYTIPDVIARFKRMQGYNVLFPMGWHITGSPIVGIAERIKNRDPHTIWIYRDVYKVPEEILWTFEDPVNIVKYFMKAAKETFIRAGFSVDWSREFYTTSLFPPFSKFIEWQFLKLKEKGYIVKGAHRVRWDPVVGTPLGDHDLMEGEDVPILEYVIIKFELKEGDETIYLPAATLRPETVYGVTNMWINPNATYVKAKVKRGGKEETWIISKEAAYKLSFQDREIEVIEEFKGEKLIGKYVRNPVTGDEVIILPAEFVDPDNATGVVMSVPAHAPFDHVALEDLKRESEILVKYDIDPRIVEEITYISLIKLEGYGEFPAVEEVQKLGIKSQKDREKLEQATKTIYKAEYHKGIFKVPPYDGKPVQEVKELIAKEMMEKGIAEIMYEFAEKNVISRFGNRAVIKIIHDQWFIDYGNSEWKEKARKALARMKIYPETRRAQFEAIIDWLDKKACARKVGLGTPLPWDPEWVIESLSDSTIYMAYYTISRHINRLREEGRLDPEKLTPEFFDYIFLEEFSEEREKELEKKTGIPAEIIHEMKEEFEYWYPLDWRCSGKDLIPNHLTFFIFNHVAIFREEHWPKGIAVNGFGTLEGQKMSKSKGNVLNFIDAIEENGADVVRLYIMSLAEHDSDFDWRRKEVGKLRRQLERFYELISQFAEYEAKENVELKTIDKWLLHRLNKAIEGTTKALEEFRTRTAVQWAFYSIMNDLRWYMRRTEGRDDEAKRFVLRKLADIWVRLMAPFTPHICEELWEKLGGEGFVSLAKWPEPVDEWWNEEVEVEEDFIKSLIEDIKEIIEVAKIESPKRAYIYTAPEWKWKVYEVVAEKREFKSAMAELMKDEEIRKHGKEVAKLVQAIIKERAFDVKRIDEEKVLRESKDFLEKELGLEVIINPEEDKGGKKRQAIPLKPAVFIE